VRSAVPVPPATGLRCGPILRDLSTFPPTSCGIATFSAALAAACRRRCVGRRRALRCAPSGPGRRGRRVGDRSRSPIGRVGVPPRRLNASDVVIVQHEYGLYDGARRRVDPRPDGDIDVPIVVVAHTVVSEPTPNQRRRARTVCALADAVVVMTETARAAVRRLRRRSHAEGPPDPARRGDTPRRRVAAAPPPDAHAPSADVGPARPRARASSGRSMRCGARAISTRTPSTSSPVRRTRRCASSTARRTARCCRPRRDPSSAAVT
jgi:hypothetical protein